MKRLTITIILSLASNFTFCQGNGLYKFAGKNGKYGFMSKTGDVVIKPAFLFVQDFNEGLAFVSKGVIKRGYKWICIDTLGNQVFDIGHDFPQTGFNEGFARISSLTEMVY